MAHDKDGWLIIGINHALCLNEGMAPLAGCCRPEMRGKWMVRRETLHRSNCVNPAKPHGAGQWTFQRGKLAGPKKGDEMHKLRFRFMNGELFGICSCWNFIRHCENIADIKVAKETHAVHAWAWRQHDAHQEDAQGVVETAHN